MYNFEDNHIEQMGKAMLSYYKTTPSMFKAPLKNSDARRMLKNIIGIRNTNALSDLEINDIIYYLERQYTKSGVLLKHRDRNMYRTT